MKFPDRFWIETAVRLTDVAEAALLRALLRRPADLPWGVLRAGALDFEATKQAWASTQVAAEIAAAPGITVDAQTGLAVVWVLAVDALPNAPGPAIKAGRDLGRTQSSWTRELANRIGSQLDGSRKEAFLRGLKETMHIRELRPVRPRPRATNIEPELVVLKQHENDLRGRFEGVDDRGTRPSAADRLAYVQALGLGYSFADVQQALAGRAEKCRRARVWQGKDTAELFLRIDWVCARRDRLEEAIRAVPADSDVAKPALVRGEHGLFVGGREVFNPDAFEPGE